MKKYSAVYPPLVERLQAEAATKQKKSPDIVKAVKTRLHQLYGAYTQDNAHKKTASIISALEAESESIIQESTVNTLLSLHASTKERLPHYASFYDFIYSNTGPVKSILDIGCGYNPFSIPLIPATGLETYYAYDIDVKVAGLLNRYFACLNLPQEAKCADLATSTPKEHADLALMCKLIPVLEAQIPGSGFKLARELNARYLLITYPLKSLGGREKGMTKHYTTAFETALAEGELGKFSLIAQQQIGHEMLHILENRGSSATQR